MVDVSKLFTWVTGNELKDYSILCGDLWGLFIDKLIEPPGKRVSYWWPNELETRRNVLKLRLLSKTCLARVNNHQKFWNTFGLYSVDVGSTLAQTIIKACASKRATRLRESNKSIRKKQVSLKQKLVRRRHKLDELNEEIKALEEEAEQAGERLAENVAQLEHIESKKKKQKKIK